MSLLQAKQLVIVRVDYIRYVLFSGATLPCAVRCMQEDCPNLEGMAILAATLPPSYTGHGVGLVFYSLSAAFSCTGCTEGRRETLYNSLH